MSEQGITASLTMAGIVRDGSGKIVNIVTTDDSPELFQSILDRITETGEYCPEHIMNKLHACTSPRTGEDSV